MFVCLDLETTGLSAKDDHIIEVAIVRFDHEKIIEEWSSLIKAPVPVPSFTTHLTGISTEMLKDAPRLEVLQETLLQKIGDRPIVGHFIPFDVGFLKEKGFHLRNLELDTCQLTQALLPNEPSYSLEVLTQKLGIVQAKAHRAHDDVKANIELFFRLLEHIRSLPQEEKKAMRTILEKSDWAWSKTILGVLDRANLNKNLVSLISPTPSQKIVYSEKHANLAELAQNISPPFLFEEGSHTYQDLLDYALSLKDKSIISVPYPALFPLHEDTYVLKHPGQYIDQKRFERFLDKDRFSGPETVLAIKVSLWLLHSENGEKSELRLVKEESSLWYYLCCQEGTEPESFYKKALNKALQKRVVVISHLHLLKDRSRKVPEPLSSNELVVGECEELVQEMEDAWHIRLSEARFLEELRRLQIENPQAEPVIDHLAAKVSILFGLLGIFLQRNGGSNDTHHPLRIETHHINTLEWNKVVESARSIEAAAAALGDICKESINLDEWARSLDFLTKLLQNNQALLWLTFGMDGQPIIHSFPENTTEIFSERVWKGMEDLRLFCHHANLKDDFAFLKRELALPPAIETVSVKDILPLPLILPDPFTPAPSSPENLPEVVRQMVKELLPIKGNIMILSQSMMVVEQLFYKLAEPVKQANRKLFAQNLGGGLGKIAKMSERSAGQNVYIGNENMLDFLLSEGVPLKMLALHRLPFSNPKDPIQQARSVSYKDPYKEFSLPQASLRFQSILNRFLGNEWEEKTIYILDPRIHDYKEWFY